YRNLHDGKVEQLTWVVETAAGVLKEAHQRELSGELTREQAQRQALATLSVLRYAGEEYFFVTDLAGRMLIHADAKLIGQDVSGLKDSNGVAFVSEMTRTAREQGRGTVAYLWPKRPNTEPVDKVTYVSHFDPWNWMLATGVYIDDIKEQFRRELLSLAALGIFMLGLMAGGILLIAPRISKPMGATLAAIGLPMPQGV